MIYIYANFYTEWQSHKLFETAVKKVDPAKMRVERRYDNVKEFHGDVGDCGGFGRAGAGRRGIQGTWCSGPDRRGPHSRDRGLFPEQLCCSGNQVWLFELCSLEGL